MSRSEPLSASQSQAEVGSSLVSQRANVFSQNGEDGIIEAIFDIIGTETRWCCEFGAWDGIHFSNTRRLIENGWSGVLIEADQSRHSELVRNCDDFPGVTCVHEMLGSAADLDRILEAASAPRLDLLVIDIDGNDFEFFSSMRAKPRVVCVEVNAGHNPERGELLPVAVAADNVGQPFAAFQKVAEANGYKLVAYTGNAFYVAADSIGQLQTTSPAHAYRDFQISLSNDERDWLYLVNKGLVPPFYRFHNPLLARRSLKLSSREAASLYVRHLPAAARNIKR